MAIDSYQKRARRALRESIKHWTIDIVERLKVDQIYISKHNAELIWVSDGLLVPCHGGQCSLCRDFDCSDCPLRAVDFPCSCMDSVWSVFIDTPTQAAARSVVNKLIIAYRRYE